MATYLAPGVFMEERSTGARPIPGVSTSTAAFVGVAERGPVGRATLVTGFAEFVKRFGGPIPVVPGAREHYLYYAVRNFFELGGTRCYVVRVAHYTDIDDRGSLTAKPASAELDGTQLDGTAVADALHVEAITPGTWGTALEVAVSSTSKFQLLLAENIPAGQTTGINLVENDDVVPGSVLYLVHEIVGVVESVDATARTVKFAGPLMEGGTSSAATLAADAVAFKPDFSLVTTVDLAAAVDLSATDANPPTDLKLTSVEGVAPGDSLQFVVEHALVVVRSVEATTVGGRPATKAVIAPVSAPVTLPAFPADRTRVYARDFALQVRLDGEVVETHASLSLAATNAADFVDDRLGPESGGSQYIVATRKSSVTANDIVMPNIPFTALAGSANDGLTDLSVSDFVGSALAGNGLHALDPIEDFSILAVPPSRLTSTAEPDPVVHQRNLTATTIAWVENRKDCFYIVDPPPAGGTDPIGEVRAFRANFSSSYAALYFPRIEVVDPASGRRIAVPPSGAVAGVFARSDAQRGVHKAPAGIDVGILSTAAGTAHPVTAGENDVLYPESINAIRSLRDGIVIWGSRTLSADALWQQVNIRRLFLFLERSIELGTQWVVFEPNDPSLWKTIERTIRAFLRIQWLDGKLVGATEDHAFFVRCNAGTNPPEVVAAGRVVTEIGVAPSRPAEFVVFRISQFAGRQA